MSKNVLVISTSLRHSSNSEALAHAFAEGAEQAGHNVEVASLRGAELKFCIGCLSCQRRADGHCVFSDDADALVQRMRKADVLAFATPIYYYEMAGQMKTLLDRANPLYCVDYDFRDVYFLGSAAEAEDAAFDRAVEGLNGWIECFEHARLAGELRAGGLEATGEAAADADLLDRARAMGAAV